MNIQDNRPETAKASGGRRTGAGRPKKKNPTKQYPVRLHESEYNSIIKKHGDLLKAVLTFVPATDENGRGTDAYVPPLA